MRRHCGTRRCHGVTRDRYNGPIRANMALVDRKARAWVVYGMYDPFTGALRYIGFTGKVLRTRITMHLADARAGRGGNAPLKKWLLSIAQRGFRPEGRILSSWGSQDEARKAERAAIWANSAPNHHRLLNYQGRHMGCSCSDCRAPSLAGLVA